VFLNDNFWLATAFAFSLVMAAFGLLFFLAWLEPRGERHPAPRALMPPAPAKAKPLSARARRPAPAPQQ
jgi:hypothetical protein